MEENKEQNHSESPQATPIEESGIQSSTKVQEQPQQESPTATSDYAADDEESVATAEEVAAYTRQAAEKRAQKKERGEKEVEKEFGEFIPADSLIDPYTEPDPTIPWVKYEESPFLCRGCRKCPTAYSPVSSVERRSCSKVTSTNWLAGIRQPCDKMFDVVEVRFKNNRKDFYRLPDGIDVSEGDVVAVEGMPGHDIGIVTLTGEVCRIQMKKHKIDPDSPEIKKLYRRAKTADIEKWIEAMNQEDEAMRQTRQIADSMGLVMKIDDVEMQGDQTKAIFYYTADDRVDFRGLIKVLAEEFRVRIEMKQIGVRQEAGRIGGIGTCGRELCCCTWLTNFKSVTTSAAKVQQIHPNPQKLAGQCGKLKCCLNFEADVYADALKKFPPAGQAIRFQKGLALYKKTDVFRGIMWYAYEGENDLYALTAENVKKVIEMNRNQQYPERMEDFKVELMSTSALEQESSNAEFETELRKLADAGNDRKDARGSRESREGREPQRRDGRSRRDGGRQNREIYDTKDVRDTKEKREQRDSRSPRNERDGQTPRDNAKQQPRNRQGQNTPRNGNRDSRNGEGRHPHRQRPTE